MRPLSPLLAVAAALAVAGCGASTSGSSAGSHTAATTMPRSATTAAARTGIPSGDWSTFDFNAQRSGVGPADTGIRASNLHSLKLRTVRLDGTVDASAVELHAVRVDGRTRDVTIVTTTYGRTIAVDPGTGRRLWQFSPSSASGLTGSAQITNTTPVIDPDRRYVYAASPDGFVHKLAVSNGRQVWATRITYDATREKLAAALNIEGGSVIAVTDGYVGDTPHYEGHVVTLSRASGHVTHVFNTLCSNVRHLLDPPGECPYSDSAIWGRSGAVVEPGTGRILVATGNGESSASVSFNGRTNWSDSVLELSPSLKLLHNWTPSDQLRLTRDDLDLGSTSPALLPKTDGMRLAVQGGKAGILSLLNLDRLDGTTGSAGPRTGGELQDLSTPGGTDLFTEPAVWTHDGHVYVLVADNDGTAAYELGADHRLHVAWQDATPGTSPVVAGGLLYVYNQIGGALVVRSPATGAQLDSLPAPSGHWNSPIVVGGRIILPTGNANDHLGSGNLLIWHLPGR